MPAMKEREGMARNGSSPEAERLTKETGGEKQNGERANTRNSENRGGYKENKATGPDHPRAEGLPGQPGSKYPPVSLLTRMLHRFPRRRLQHRPMLRERETRLGQGD
jgi:hypothetical protein